VAYRCRDCDGYDTLLTGTAFAKTQQSPSTLVLLLRGSAKGETAHPRPRSARAAGHLRFRPISDVKWSDLRWESGTFRANR
jgi:hypothetical protein